MTIEKSMLASLPDEVQKMVIRSIYPDITEEERILVKLLKKGAVSEKTGIQMSNEYEPALETLIDAEHVLRSGNRLYISKDAQMIAKGALSIYPELQEV